MDSQENPDHLDSIIVKRRKVEHINEDTMAVKLCKLLASDDALLYLNEKLNNLFLLWYGA